MVSSRDDGRVLVWDPATPNASPIELGRQDDDVQALAILPDGRVVTGNGRQLLLWDPATPRTGPVQLGTVTGGFRTVTTLPDGRVVSLDHDQRLLVWDPATPGAGQVALDRLDIVEPSPGDRWTKKEHRSGVVTAVAGLPDGLVASDGSGAQVLVWDPATPGANPVRLGRHNVAATSIEERAFSRVAALAVLSDGRVVSGDDDGAVLVWDPVTPGADPVQLGRHDNKVQAMAVLPDGQVVSGDKDGRLLVWDPATPSADPVQLGRHDNGVQAVAVMPDGRVVSGGDDARVLVWDMTTRREIAQLGCSVTALATGLLGHRESCLVIAHKEAGFSFWSLIDEPRR